MDDIPAGATGGEEEPVHEDKILIMPKLHSLLTHFPTASIFLRDMNNTKWCNGFYIEFRQNVTKETFSYDEHLKS